MKKMLVVDGNSILNRAFYGIHPLNTREGIPTNAVFGFINILLGHLDNIAPDYAAVAFDLPAPTFRHKSYDGYKANRHGMPDELAAQLPWAKKSADILGMHVLTLEGWEADDILGTLSKIGEDEGDTEVYLVTGDRDSLQLISDRTTVLLAANTENIRFDRAKFTETYGIQPDSFVQVKALMGDSSDNIPGVPGIGEKTALKLISEFGNLDRLYEQYEDSSLTKSTVKKLREGRNSAYMSLSLAAIDRAAPLGISCGDISYGGINRTEMLELCIKLELNGFIKRLGLDGEQNRAVPTAQYDEIVCEKLCEMPKIHTAVSIDFDNGCLYAVSDTGHFSAHFERADEILDYLCDYQRKFALHDSKTIHTALHKLCPDKNIDISVEFDTMLAAYVLNSSDSAYTLSALAQRYLSRTYTDGTDDSSVIYALTPILTEALENEKSMALFTDIELPLSHVLYNMEIEGFKVDREGLRGFSAELAQKADEYAEQIYFLAGRTFNPNSPKQLGEVLFDEMGLPSPKRGKTGYSTSADVLEKLRTVHPIINSILEYRQVTKFKSTYADGLYNVAGDDGRIHTTFNQTITSTGRLSSTEPNLQNIPIRHELGRRFRKYFIPSDSRHVLVDADYSQIELRLLAHISGDKIMTDAFRSGTDIHAVTASQVFGVPLEDVTDAMRKRAKAVNFGIVYGISDFSLAQDIGVTKKQAGEYIRDYLAKYSDIDAYLKDIVEKANRDGFVTTLNGRRRYIPELKSGKAMLRSFGERVAMNSPIQGTAADIIKIAMINTERALAESGIDAKLILQIHDELIVEASREDSECAANILRREMEGAADLSVPLTVSIDIGDTWFMQ